MLLSKDYGPGSLATIGVLDAARRYASTNERFDQELKALSTLAAMEHKRFVEMYKNRVQRPIEQDWENPGQLRHSVSTVLHDVIGWNTHSPTDDQLCGNLLQNRTADACYDSK